MKKLLLFLPILFLSAIASATLPAITGTMGLCGGTTTTLSNATTGGTWTSSNTAIATVGASSGIVNGIANGTATISYTLGVDVATTIVTVISSPPATLGGCNNIGVGDTLVYPTMGCASGFMGMVYSSNPAVAGSDWGGAIVGVAPGSATVYMVGSTGCIMASRNITVTPTRLISKIVGPDIICPGTTTTFTDATPGGVWTSSSLSTATISSTGIVNAVAPGMSVISYSLPSSSVNCFMNVLVYDRPAPFTGPTSVCVGDSIMLYSSFCGYCTDVCMGGWFSSGDTSIAKNTGGKFKGINPGTVTVTYTGYQSPGCARSAVLTVNPTSVAPIVGTATVCLGATTTLSTSTTGGLWSTTGLGIATVSSAGVVSGISTGTAIITYTINNTCGTYFGTAVVTVNTVPAAATITGASSVCATASTLFTASVTGGVWASSNTSVATVNTSGSVTGVAAGVATIYYSLSNACGTTAATRSVTVNPLPVAGTISGTASVCVGATTALTASVSGGIWSTSSGTGATVSTSGVVSGITVGTTTISYAVTNGCGTAVATRIITVNPLPVAGTITGPDSVCVAATATLTPSLTGGAWTSSAITIASVASSVVTGIAAGFTIISYSVTNGCGTAVATKLVIVKPLPVAGTIGGATTVCPGASTTLTSTISGGVWSISGTAATISSSGIVTGLAAGTTIISYTVTNSCGTDVTTQTITVSPLPDAGTLTGSDSVCAGDTIMLGSSVSSGIWSSSNVSVATVSATGVVTGIAPGSTIIMYTVTNGCGTDTATYIISVDPTYTAVVTITAFPGFFIASGSYDTLVATVTGAGPSPTYQWFKNTVPIVGATNSTYISNSFTSGDSICCRVIGTGWCAKESWSCNIIQVSTVGIWSVPTATHMALFPNPNEGLFMVKGVSGSNNPVTIEVRNMLGQLISSEKYVPVHGTVNRQLFMDNTLPNGPYVLSVISEDGNSIFHSGFIIRR